MLLPAEARELRLEHLERLVAHNHLPVADFGAVEASVVQSPVDRGAGAADFVCRFADRDEVLGVNLGHEARVLCDERIGVDEGRNSVFRKYV